MTPYDPHKSEKDIEVGDFYYKRGNYKAAVSRYQEALYYNSRNPLATFKLADALEKDNQLDDAAVYYSEYDRLYPDGAQITEVKTALQRLAPRVQAASPKLRQMQIDHGLQAGEMLMAQKNYPDAVGRFCDVAEIDPANARAIFRLAQALQETGEFAAAYQNYQAYLKLEPSGRFAPDARREIQRLGPQVQQGRATSPASGTLP